MARQADDAGLVYRVRYDLNLSDEEKRSGKQASIWAVMTATERDLGALADDPRWQPPTPARVRRSGPTIIRIWPRTCC